MQIKQITADITPILNTFSQGILQNPTASSTLDELTSGPGVTAFIDQVQSLADMLSPNIQSLLVTRHLSQKACTTHTPMARPPKTCRGSQRHDAIQPVILGS